VTAEFNLNALRHLNRKLHTDFDLDAFEHAAVWVEDMSRIEMHLISKQDQRVHIGDEEVTIKRGEHIRTECSHKYTLESIAELAAEADLRVARVWMDPERQFSVQLLEPRVLQEGRQKKGGQEFSGAAEVVGSRLLRSTHEQEAGGRRARVQGPGSVHRPDGAVSIRNRGLERRAERLDGADDSHRRSYPREQAGVRPSSSVDAPLARAARRS